MKRQGEALRIIFSRNNVNISDLAERMKMSRTTVYAWFDMTIVPYENLQKVSKALDLDVFELMRKELGLETFKKYNPVVVSEPKEKNLNLSQEEITMQIKLDGHSETLDRLIEKLRVLNEALSHYSEATSR